VIRLLDAHSGSYAEVRSARAGLLRACAHVTAAAGETDISGLRVLLVADLLTRVAELRNLQVLTVLARRLTPMPRPHSDTPARIDQNPPRNAHGA
jgi:hypothetical protein